MKVPQTVVLTAPTGSGKTVIAAAAIESLLDGDAKHAKDAQATVLWITDQPDLNEQTRRKMLQHSTSLTPARLKTIETDFHQQTFDPGKVYFLNTQKLGKNSSLVQKGNDRHFTLWETIANTERSRPGKFFVFIDEAHRGMNESAATRDEAATIVQRFIKGDASLGLDRMPFIVGISATPQRFNALISGTSRSLHHVDVNPADVRESGLIKDTVVLWHPTEDQPSDMTMLRAAARAWLDYSRRWAAYCGRANAPLVLPVLAVQVRDGKGKSPSDTSLGDAVAAIRQEVGDEILLPEVAFAHAFDQKHAVKAGDLSLRYIAPPDVEADPDVRVVFFKLSLNTGWDCPRAEVMMSFRTAKDATFIAQLVGRMVRTPLARRVEGDDRLNSVALYLPHYDAVELARVIESIQRADAETLPPTEVRTGEEIVSVSMAPGSEAAFEALSAIPSYTIPASRKVVGTRRLMGLARLLTNDGIESSAIASARTVLLRAAGDAYAALTNSGKMRAILDEKAVLDVRSVTWAVGSNVTSEAGGKLAVSQENIDDLFAAAGRRLGEGLHLAYMKQRVSAGATSLTAKLEVFALTADTETVEHIHKAGNDHVQIWMKKYQTAIKKLPESQRLAYGEIQQTAEEPTENTLTFPESYDARVAKACWSRHLYVDKDGEFPVALTTWEALTIKEELAREDLVGWLRNEPKKPWSFCAPYEIHGNWRGVYPDFLIVRNVDGVTIVDIVDPHLLQLEDAPFKAAGLARFAAKYPGRFGRIELIMAEDQIVRRLDLTLEGVREHVKGVQTSEHLRQLFTLLSTHIH